MGLRKTDLGLGSTRLPPGLGDFSAGDSLMIKLLVPPNDLFSKRMSAAFSLTVSE